MNDLQSINELISSAVKNSSYVTVIISSCVFLIYTAIIKIVDIVKAKDRAKPLLEMANAVKEISQNVVKLNAVLDKTIKESEAKEINRINQIIDASFDSFKSSILDECIDIIIHNNIETNRDSIKQNIYKCVNTEYYKIYSIFSSYEHNDINVSTSIKDGWIDDVTSECLKIIYNGQEAVSRIRQLNNKFNIITEEYSIYVKNKVFNH